MASPGRPHTLPSGCTRANLNGLGSLRLLLLARRLRRPRGDMSTLPSVLSRPYLGESGIVLHRGHRQLFKKPVHTTPWGPGVERGVRGDLRGLSTRSPVQYVTRQMCNKFAHHDHFLARACAIYALWQGVFSYSRRHFAQRNFSYVASSLIFCVVTLHNETD